MSHPIVEIEKQIKSLSPDEQLWLMEKIAQHNGVLPAYTTGNYWSSNITTTECQKLSM